MHARLCLVVARDGRGDSTVARMSGEAPLIARITRRRPLVVHLVGGAAGPLGGDSLTTSVEVGEGAAVSVRSVAASMVHPGPHARATSSAEIAVQIAAGGRLDWWPEPTVSVVGSDHVMATNIEVHPQGELRWVDAVVLGRHGESGGALTIHQRVTVGGRPLLHHTVRVGGPDAAHEGRVLVTAITVGPSYDGLPAAAHVDAGVRAARLPLGGGAVAWTGLGEELTVVLAELARLGLRPGVDAEHVADPQSSVHTPAVPSRR